MPDKKRKRIGPVLVAVDFSESSANALLWGARAADAFGAPLLAVHVVHDPGSTPGYYQHVRKAKKHIHRIEEAAEEMMADFVKRVRSKHPKLAALKAMEIRLVVGLPVNRILEIAKRRAARQIVVGSRGRSGLPALLIGSKALKVAQLAPMPVTIVKGREWGPK
ncbi:MAG: universal stress protein [bacterium]|nr:universal stress protein [bacterium]